MGNTIQIQLSLKEKLLSALMGFSKNDIYCMKLTLELLKTKGIRSATIKKTKDDSFIISANMEQ